MKGHILAILIAISVANSAKIQVDKVAIGDTHLFDYEATFGTTYESNRFVRFFPSDGQDTRVYVESIPS